MICDLAGNFKYGVNWSLLPLEFNMNGHFSVNKFKCFIFYSPCRFIEHKRGCRCDTLSLCTKPTFFPMEACTLQCGEIVCVSVILRGLDAICISTSLHTCYHVFTFSPLYRFVEEKNNKKSQSQGLDIFKCIKTIFLAFVMVTLS